jgi:hypothetical protein
MPVRSNKILSRRINTSYVTRNCVKDRAPAAGRIKLAIPMQFTNISGQLAQATVKIPTSPPRMPPPVAAVGCFFPFS